MGTVSFPSLRPLLDEISLLPGDLIEVGVFRGDTFLKLLPVAEAAGRLCIAVDSFAGMAEPGPHDGTEYPAGKFNVGGPGRLRSQVQALGSAGSALVVDGWVPQVFLSPELTGRTFAFAHVDLDHCDPTLDTLRWLWPRITPGGVVAVHDYFDNEPGLASWAVREFSKRYGAPFDVVASTDGVTLGTSSHAVFRREAAR